MDINTGHLINTVGCTDEELEKLKQSGYTTVPGELRRKAGKELADGKEIYVELKSGNGNQMVDWGSGMRKKRKSRNKMAKNSRRRNRG